MLFEWFYIYKDKSWCFYHKTLFMFDLSFKLYKFCNGLDTCNCILPFLIPQVHFCPILLVLSWPSCLIHLVCPLAFQSIPTLLPVSSSGRIWSAQLLLAIWFDSVLSALELNQIFSPSFLIPLIWPSQTIYDRKSEQWPFRLIADNSDFVGKLNFSLLACEIMEIAIQLTSKCS